MWSWHPVAVSCVVNRRLTGLWNLCYIEAAILIYPWCYVQEWWALLMWWYYITVSTCISIALTLFVSLEAELSLESWLLLRGQTKEHPGIPKLPLWTIIILSHTCPIKCPHNVYSFVLACLNYAALIRIAFQHVVFSTRFIKDMYGTLFHGSVHSPTFPPIEMYF